MGTSTKGILFGDRSADEVAAAVRRHPGVTGPVEVQSTSIKEMNIVKIGEAGSSDFRSLAVFDGQMIGDDMDIYSGERTLISLGASGDSVGIVTSAAKAFGGFVNDFDSIENGWRFVEPTAPLDLSPAEKLTMALVKILDPRESEIMRRTIEDPAKLEAFSEALEEFHAAAPTAPKP